MRSRSIKQQRAAAVKQRREERRTKRRKVQSKPLVLPPEDDALLPQGVARYSSSNQRVVWPVVVNPEPEPLEHVDCDAPDIGVPEDDRHDPNALHTFLYGFMMSI